jgi:hypothetical protein
MKPDQPRFGVHLKSAVLCLEAECSTVFDGGAARTCPRCGSFACCPISIWLDRVERVHPPSPTSIAASMPADRLARGASTTRLARCAVSTGALRNRTPSMRNRAAVARSPCLRAQAADLWPWRMFPRCGALLALARE